MSRFSEGNFVKRINLSLKSALLFFVLAAVAAPLFAEEGRPNIDYYLSPAGNDAADGSPGSPFCTLARARDQLLDHRWRERFSQLIADDGHLTNPPGADRASRGEGSWPPPRSDVPGESPPWPPADDDPRTA